MVAMRISSTYPPMLAMRMRQVDGDDHRERDAQASLTAEYCSTDEARDVGTASGPSPGIQHQALALRKSP